MAAVISSPFWGKAALLIPAEWFEVIGSTYRKHNILIIAYENGPYILSAKLSPEACRSRLLPEEPKSGTRPVPMGWVARLVAIR